MFRYLPEQASEIAPKIDWLNNIITDLSVLFTVAIVGAMVYFAIRYRKKNNVDHETPKIEGSHTLEIIWTVVPTLISIYVMYWGVVYYKELRTVPKGEETVVIYGYGQKWKWDFEYENGKKTSGKLTVPVNKNIKVILTSRDVLHSFFIPAMRVKTDVLPDDKYTFVKFKPVKTGNYHVFCTEYCGDAHWNMQSNLSVVSEVEYEQWLDDNSEELIAQQMGLSDLGEKLYVEKGCNACHSLDGLKVVGPTFQKLYNKEGEFDNGEKYTADEAYLKNSILNPNSQIVAGYLPNLMPNFQGQLSDREISALISFIKDQDGSAPEEATTEETEEASAADENLTPLEKGEKVYQTKLCITCHSIDGTKLVGPTFKGLYNKKGKLADGKEYVADDAYLAKSISEPQAEIVEGYPAGAMPALGLTDAEISDVTEYIKTLK